MDLHLIKYLIREANKLGRRGFKVIDWTPNEDATGDWRGRFVISKPIVDATRSAGDD